MAHRGHALTVAMLLAAAQLWACASTQYTPKPYPYVKIVQRAGMPQLRGEDDRGYSAAPLGGDLDRAVESVPLAREHAEAASDEALLGIILAVGGAVVMPAGTTLLLFDSVDDQDGLTAVGALGLGLTVAGIAMLVAGMSSAISSQAHYYDAMNVYNDAMWERDHPILRGDGLPKLAPEPAE